MKIFAIGMNYTEHNKSLHGTLSKPERPVIFTKADSALLNNGKPFFIPDHLGRIEYETELVVRICKLGKTIPQRFAHRYYDAVTVGIDFTAREMQKKLREAGQPWELAKGSAISRLSTSISTSTARMCRKAVRVICSTRWMKSSPTSASILRSRLETCSIRVVLQDAVR